MLKPRQERDEDTAVREEEELEMLFDLEDPYFKMEAPAMPDDVLAQMARDYRQAGGS